MYQNIYSNPEYQSQGGKIFGQYGQYGEDEEQEYHNEYDDETDIELEQQLLLGGAGNEYLCDPIKFLKSNYSSFYELLQKLCLIDWFKQILDGQKQMSDEERKHRKSRERLVKKLTQGITGKELFERYDPEKEKGKKKDEGARYPWGMTFIVPKNINSWLDVAKGGQPKPSDVGKMKEEIRRHVLYASLKMMTQPCIYVMNAVEGLYKVTKKGNDFELFSLSWNANIEESTNSICKIKDDDKFKPLYPVKCIFTCDAIISQEKSFFPRRPEEMKNYSEKKGNRNLEDIDTAMPKKKGKGIYGGWCQFEQDRFEVVIQSMKTYIGKLFWNEPTPSCEMMKAVIFIHDQVNKHGSDVQKRLICTAITPFIGSSLARLLNQCVDDNFTVSNEIFFKVLHGIHRESDICAGTSKQIKQKYLQILENGQMQIPTQNYHQIYKIKMDFFQQISKPNQDNSQLEMQLCSMYEKIFKLYGNEFKKQFGPIESVSACARCMQYDTLVFYPQLFEYKAKQATKNIKNEATTLVAVLNQINMHANFDIQNFQNYKSIIERLITIITSAKSVEVKNKIFKILYKSIAYTCLSQNILDDQQFQHDFYVSSYKRRMEKLKH